MDPYGVYSTNNLVYLILFWSPFTNRASQFSFLNIIFFFWQRFFFLFFVFTGCFGFNFGFICLSLIWFLSIIVFFSCSCCNFFVRGGSNDFRFFPILIGKIHCVKSVRIRSYSGPYFLAFGLYTERHGVSLHIQSECGKIRTRITRNIDTFHEVISEFGSFK